MITEKHIVTITTDDKYFKTLKNSCLEQGYKPVGINTESETFEKSITYMGVLVPSVSSWRQDLEEEK